MHVVGDGLLRQCFSVMCVDVFDGEANGGMGYIALLKCISFLRKLYNELLFKFGKIVEIKMQIVF